MDRSRLIFMGTPDLAAVCLRALQSFPLFDIVGVVTQPDRPKGRDLRLSPSPVKVLALETELPVLQPLKAREENFVNQLRSLRPDVCVVAAYGQILPQAILDVAPFGCVNVHTSLLPKYRGAAPIQWALINGEAETGVSLMKMDAQMDTGPILAQESIAIQPQDNAATLHDRLANLGGSMLLKFLPQYLAGQLSEKPQANERATHAPKIKKENGQIDWKKPAHTILNQFRGLYPWPGLFTYYPSGDGKAVAARKKFKIWKLSIVEGNGNPGILLRIEEHAPVIACGEGAIRLDELQTEGGKRMNAKEFIKGHPFPSNGNLG